MKRLLSNFLHVFSPRHSLNKFGSALDLSKTLILLPLVVACGCGKDDITYSVGDIYSHNGKVGIIVSVSRDGLHGKIVSTDETEDFTWAVEDIVTGATDEDNGMNNMKKIRAIDGWHDKFPAFAWCADKGKDWYLPAINELKTVYESQTVGRSGEYWSSTEYKDVGVNTLNMRTCANHAAKKNTQYIKIRAMAKF